MKKKVTLIFREKRSGNYSIEELFETLRPEFEKEFEIEIFTCPSADRFQNMLAVRKLKSDVFHITGDVNYLSFVLPSQKTIITVHDVGHFEQTLKGFKRVIYKYLWLKWPLTKVKHITTISHFTKQRIISNLNIKESKIQVISNPSPSSVFKKSAVRELTEGDSVKILQIGSGHNKNIERLIEAVKGLNVELLLIRKKDTVLEDLLLKNKIKYRIFSFLTYEEVFQKYQECDMVYFASNYEGFGVPILESQLVGRPIITSKVASMPEVAGEGAYFVNHESVSEIRTAITDLIANKSLRDSLVHKGFENIQRFDISTISKQYKDLYKIIL